jgi:DNA-binding winged helix-turn-helix (wHTH) protein
VRWSVDRACQEGIELSRDTELEAMPPKMIVIGDYLFMWDSRELRGNNGETTILRQDSTKVLACLAASPNEIVSTDALVAELGSDNDHDRSGVERAIDDIRRALRDSDHKLIEAFPQQGYRLNAQPVAETIRQQAAHEGPETPPSTQRQRTNLRGLATVLFVFLLLALVLYIIFWPDIRARSETDGIQPTTRLTSWVPAW